MSLVIQAGRERHTLRQADSGSCRYRKDFDLLLTSPPYFHPCQPSSRHGICFTGDAKRYAETISEILLRCAEAVRGRRVCIVKTDVWHKGALYPVSYEIADSCISKGLQLRAHWIWQRLAAFSPYGPSFSNVFIFGDQFRRPHYSGLIMRNPLTQKVRQRKPKLPQIFELLIGLLTKKGQIVIDPFAGTGGVLEAAALLGRRSVGIELSTAQVRLARRRLRRIRGLVLSKNQLS